jgi:hypothetical protein
MLPNRVKKLPLLSLGINADSFEFGAKPNVSKQAIRVLMKVNECTILGIKLPATLLAEFWLASQGN